MSRDNRALPLVRRFPGLARLPRVALGRFPTPVVQATGLSPSLWVKRDDLSAEPLGGNKVRALEFLLGEVQPGDRIVTVGAAGSTHALAVATYGRQLGARVTVVRWQQEMNDTAHVVASRLEHAADDAPLLRTPATAYLRAWFEHRRGARWVPAGGSSPLGVLGHVNAALELADQIEAGELPTPDYVVVPLGTGGTAAGLTLGLAVADIDAVVIGARVVPWIVGRRGRVLSLIERTATLIEQHSGARLPRPRVDAVTIAHGTFGGAYGRETAWGRAAGNRFAQWAGTALDPTYSAKACALALQIEGARVLFWLTFDSRILGAP